MPNVVTPIVERTSATSSRSPNHYRRFTPLLLAAAMALALWVATGGQDSAPPTTTGLMTPPIREPIATREPVTAPQTTEVAPVRPRMNAATALGPMDLEPSGLMPVALYGYPDQLITDSHGALWWRADWGIARFDPSLSGEPSFFMASDDIFFGSITTISPALETGIWVAAGNSTLRRFDGVRFVEVLETPEPVCQVVETERLGLWAVGCGWTPRQPGWVAREPSAAWEARGWLYVWNGEHWEADPEGRPHPGAAELTGDSSGNVWVANCEVGEGVNRGGLSVFDGTAWTTFTSDDGLPSGVIQAIVGDAGGVRWVRTFGGPSIFDGTAWTSPSGDPEQDRREWRGLRSIVALGDQSVATTAFPYWSWKLVRIMDEDTLEIPLAAEAVVSNLATANGHAWLLIDGVLHRIGETMVEPALAAAPPAAGISPQPEMQDWQITAISAREALLLAGGRPWRCVAEDGCTAWPTQPSLVDVIVSFDGELLALGDDQLLRLDGEEWIPVTPFSAWERLHGS